MRARSFALLRASRSNTFTRNLAIPIAAYFLLIFAAHIRPIGWNTFDDQQSYMALAEKAAVFNHMPADPFNERRTNSGLGAAIFLDRTMLAAADDTTMDFLDSGFGYLVLILAFWSTFKALGLSSRAAVLLLYLVPFFPFGKINLTIIFLSASFFLSMLLLLLREVWEKPLRSHTAILLGLLLGTASAVKSSNIPFGVLFLAMIAAAMALHSGKIITLLRPIALAVAAVLAVMLPWMVALHHDQGTFFFPSLGRGVHSSAYGFLPLPSQAMPKLYSLMIAAPNGLILLVLGILTFLLTRKRTAAMRLPLLAFFAAAFSATLLVAISTGAEALDRYTLPFAIPCVFLLACSAITARRQAPTAHVVAAVLAIMGCARLSNNILRVHDSLSSDIAQLRTLTGHSGSFPYFIVRLDPGTMRSHAGSVLRAQQAVPAGQTILESTETAYGYDWKRNTIYIADYPGMAGPRPGPPFLGTAEDLRLYLLACGVHYVIFDRSLYVPINFELFRQQPAKPPAWHDVEMFTERKLDSATWSIEQYNVEQRFRAQLIQIATRHPALYDDGRIKVIALD